MPQVFFIFVLLVIRIARLLHGVFCAMEGVAVDAEIKALDERKHIIKRLTESLKDLGAARLSIYVDAYDRAKRFAQQQRAQKAAAITARVYSLAASCEGPQVCVSPRMFCACVFLVPWSPLCAAAERIEAC